jgi:hypothetical protein
VNVLEKGGDCSKPLRTQFLSAEKTYTRKEVKTMKYTKPEVTLINPALEAIQGEPKGSKLGVSSDSIPPVAGKDTTLMAYEADE